MFSLLDRFCRYVRIDTQAREGAGTYPSSPGQWDLARLLVEELRTIGVQDVAINDYGIITGTIPATVKHAAPVMAWFAHMDTSPEFSGKNVNPIVHRNYQGGDIPLPGDPTRIITVKENPELKHYIGGTVITTDGTTLLGADNKAGIAVIMGTAEYLLQHPEIPHGLIRICFTCDEEIGHGVDHVDLKALGAVVGYTLDGLGQAELEGETFSADKAIVTITGVNIHPSIAKGRMVSAIRLAAKFLEMLPQDRLQPELTERREGFIHPVTIEGGVPEVKMMFILRDFATAALATEAALLREIGDQLMKRYPQARIDVKTEKQYRNMADGLKKEPRAMAHGEEAMKRAGLKPIHKSLRGGTDGSRLTELGLPTPNLSTGEHNPHSPLEWTTVEDMEAACKVLVELAQVWGQEKA